MSNKFGEFWYIPTIDKDGFDIHGANGIVDFETTSEKAIVNCQRRYIAELEANLASALEVSRIKGEELAAAIAENEAYRAALKPFAESVAIDTDLMKARDGAGLYIRNSDGDRFVPIETSDDELHVRQLRAAAEVYAKFKGAGDAKSSSPLE